MPEKYYYKVILTTVIFNKEKKILLAKRGKNETVLPGYWGIPGGKIEALGNIQNIFEEELKREVREEVGIEINNIHYVENHLHESGKINVCFISTLLSGNPKALDETEEVGWFTLSEAKEMLLTPHTLERITLASKKIKK